MRAFAEDRKETQPKTNIVDFLEHLKKERRGAIYRRRNAGSLLTNFIHQF